MPHQKRLKWSTLDLDASFTVSRATEKPPIGVVFERFVRSPYACSHPPIRYHEIHDSKTSYFCASNNRHHLLRTSISVVDPSAEQGVFQPLERGTQGKDILESQTVGFADEVEGGFHSSGGGSHCCNRSNKGRASGVDSRVGSLGGCSQVNSQNPCSSKVCRIT